MCLDDQVSTLLGLISVLRPGTVIAFQEFDHRSHLRTIPECEEFNEVTRGIENAAAEKVHQAELWADARTVSQNRRFPIRRIPKATSTTIRLQATQEERREMKNRSPLHTRGASSSATLGGDVELAW